MHWWNNVHGIYWGNDFRSSFKENLHRNFPMGRMSAGKDCNLFNLKAKHIFLCNLHIETSVSGFFLYNFWACLPTLTSHIIPSLIMQRRMSGKCDSLKCFCCTKWSWYSGILKYHLVALTEECAVNSWFITYPYNYLEFTRNPSLYHRICIADENLYISVLGWDLFCKIAASLF